VSDYRFEDDLTWVKFKCIELASERNKYGSIESVIETAEKIQSYILPKARTLNITGGKDAQKNHHQ